MKKPLFVALVLIIATSCSDWDGNYSYDSEDSEDFKICNVPSEVSDLAIAYSKQYDVDPMVFLAIAWHERAGVYGWHDDYVFGFGAYDTKPWPEKYAGWETQWAFAAPKIGKFFSRNEPSSESFQSFARDIYKTTAWESYRTAYTHYVHFSSQGGNE